MHITFCEKVSTHSRPKAAGCDFLSHVSLQKSFNTQPPEGGWRTMHRQLAAVHCFNTQPPEGGWQQHKTAKDGLCGFNTQPPEGGWLKINVSSL